MLNVGESRIDGVFFAFAFSIVIVVEPGSEFSSFHSCIIFELINRLSVE